MTHPHHSPLPAAVTDNPAAQVTRPGVPVTIWHGLPAPPAPTGPGPCPGPVTREAAATIIAEFSRPGDLVAVPDGSPAVIHAAGAAGRRDVLPGPGDPGGRAAALAITACHGPGCCADREPGSRGGLAGMYGTCYRALAPGGILAVVLATAPADGQPADLAWPAAGARAAGFAYAQHIVLVYAAIDDGRLVPFRAGPGSAADPAGIRVHSDLLIFTKPGGGHALD